MSKKFKGNIRTAKVFSKINVLRDEEKGKNRGIVFIDFETPKLAALFMDHLSEDFRKKIENSKKEQPIIEYAFEDVLKLRKREDLKNKLQVLNQKQENEKLLDEIDPGRIKKKIHKLKSGQLAQDCKSIVNEALRKNDREIY